MRYCFIFIAFVSLLCSCKGAQPTDDADGLVKVKERTRGRSEIKPLIPRGLSSADSLLLAESLEKKWVKDALVYDVALRNLEGEDKAEVDKLVEEYRHSLIRYRYQENLIRERLSSEFQESDKLSYYRMDFDPDNKDNSFGQILRNHKYIFNIKKQNFIFEKSPYFNRSALILYADT